MHKISVIVITVCVIAHHSANSDESRQKRFLFTRNSPMGLIIAMAVPLDVPHNNVFMSYLFEFNYGLPTAYSNLFPGILQRLELYRTYNGDAPQIEGNVIGNTSTVQHYSQSEKFLSRRKIYKMLAHNLSNYGFNGTQCLLRAICESAETPLGQHNGILGDLFHIVFTPSSSKPENMDKLYFDAEAEGKKAGCKGYKEHCPKNIFDYITKVM